VPEKLCDFEGSKLIVKAGYSPLGMKRLLESFIALGKVHAPSDPPNKTHRRSHHAGRQTNR
jgi:hypothetical protein